MCDQRLDAAWQGDKQGQQFRVFAETVQEYAIFLIDPSGHIATWNAGAARIKGWSADEVIGQHYRMLYTPEGREAGHPEANLRAAAEQGHYEESGWRLRKDGSRFFAHIVLTPIHDAAGRITSFAKITQDITERKQAEEALRESEARLRESEERFRGLMEQAPFSVQVFSIDGRIVRVNRAWEELWGVTLDDVPDYNVHRDPQLERLGVMPLVQRAFRGEAVQIPAIRYDPNDTLPDRTRNAEPVRWVASVAYPLKDSQGRVREVVVVHEDMTARIRAEEAMRESEEQFRTGFEMAPVANAQADATGRLIRVNRKYCELTGYSEQELLGMTIRDLHHPEDWERDQATVQAMLRGDIDTYTHDKRYLRKDGSVVWVNVTASIIRGADGMPLRTLGVAIDLTERRRADEALRKSESRFRRLMEANFLGVGVSDDSGGWIEGNDELLRILGYTREEMKAGKVRWSDVTPEQYLPLDRRGVAEAKQRGACTPYEKEYVRRDGTRVPVLLGYAVLEDAAQFICFVLDLSERNEAVRRLKASEERLRLALESGRMGVWEWDIRSGKLVWTENLLALHGVTADSFGGTLESFTQLIHPEDRGRVNEAISNAIASRTPYDIEFRVVWPDGTVRWMAGKGEASYDSEGATHMLGIGMDVTDRREASERLREANQRKDEFLAMLAHELRNPLAPIRSGLDLLALTGADAEVVGPMQQQVSHLVRLVDDLLDVSRIMRGRVELRREPVELTSVLKRATDTILPQMRTRRQRLSTTLPAEPVRLMADPVRLAQVVSNLLHNASKYSDEGAEVHLSAHRVGDQAVVEICDEGVGIEPDLLPRVFDLFTQATATIDRSQGGLGIGLTVVKSLVEMHEGTVEAQSGGVGRGSRFIIRLPALAEQDAAEVVAQEIAATPSRRVLVVDDNVPAAQMLARLLERLDGHVAFLAYDGEEAIAAAQEHRPDVILLDIGLPKLDGYEVARRLRSQPEFATTLLVALTGYGTEEDRRRSIQAGCDEHLVKPPGIDSLRRMLSHEKLPGRDGEN